MIVCFVIGVAVRTTAGRVSGERNERSIVSGYVLTPDRVHPLDAFFRQTIQALSRWGLGSKDLVAALETKGPKP